MSHRNRPISEASNLTASQLLLWTGQQVAGPVPLYNMALSYTINGSLDPDLCRLAWRIVVQQNDALRTVVTDDDGVPRQRVLPATDADLVVLDMSGNESPAAAASAWAEQRCRRPFDLTDRLCDSVLIKLGSAQSIWFINQHHIVTDALSCAILWRRLGQAYADVRVGHDPARENPPAYATYVESEGATRRTRIGKKALDHWIERRSGVPLRLYGQQAVAPDTTTVRIRRSLGSDRTLQLKRLAAEPQARTLTSHLSQFNLFATVLFSYLYRVTGESRLTIGTPSHNRIQATWKETVGLFIEVLPLQVFVEPGDSFITLLDKVRMETTRFVRFAGPGTCGAVPSGAVNVLLNYVTAKMQDFAGLPTTAEWLHAGHADRQHGLRMQVHDFNARDDIVVDFDLKTSLFSPQQRFDAVGHWMRLLDAMLNNPHQLIGGVSLLNAEESVRVAPPVESAIVRAPGCDTILDSFSQQVRNDSHAAAVECPTKELSYGELDDESDRLATILRARGINTGSRVGVCLDRCTDLVVALLGVLKSGAAYVPVEAHYPISRIAATFQDAEVSAVVTHKAHASRFPSELSLVVLDSLQLETSRQSGQRVPERRNRIEPARPEEPAYILYTSGSTGRPKGVIVSHRALANYCRWAASFYARGERLAFPLFTPTAFDLTVTSLFVPLISGGRIVAYPRPPGPIDLSLLDVLRDNEVDIIKLTPSHLLLLGERELSDSRVRQLILGGEDLRTDLARRISEQIGEHIKIHNEYGPTEATVGCIIHTFERSVDHGVSVPIGRPIDNMRALVLNEQRELQPVGVVGELYLSGMSLADGYWNHPQRTAERFINDTHDNDVRWYRTGDLARWNESLELEYLGRVDDQVKIGGARIELGEIEAILQKHPNVSAAVAVVLPAANADDEPVQHCSRCGLPSTYPDATFDESGVCSQCVRFENYRDRVQCYFKSMRELKELAETIKQQRNGEYDCLMLLSGGKDSTYALCQLVDLGLKVLAFSLDNGYLSQEAKANIRRVCAELGVDQQFGSTPAMNEIFVDSLNRHANVCHGCFKTIYTLSTQLAIKKRISYIFTGLSRGQFFETRLTEDLFTGSRLDVRDIDAFVLDARNAYHRVDDAVSRLLDVSMFQDECMFTSIVYVDFYRYCPASLEEMLDYLQRRVPWIRPSDTGRSTNCLINNVGIYVHKRRRGFHNYALPYSWDVRMGHKDREAAIEELDDDIDVGEVRRIMDEIGYTEPDTRDEPTSQLVAYYVTREATTTEEIRGYLADRLPSYLLPSQVVPIDALPLTDNGKIDKTCLPRPKLIRDDRKTPYAAPKTSTEQTLARLWSDVLRFDRVGTHDNFFELNGDSLAAIQIVAKANRLGMRLSPSDLFDHQTIAALSRVVEQARIVTDGSPRRSEDLPDGPPNGTQAFTLLDDRQRDKLAKALLRSKGVSKGGL